MGPLEKMLELKEKAIDTYSRLLNLRQTNKDAAEFVEKTMPTDVEICRCTFYGYVIPIEYAEDYIFALANHLANLGV